MAIPTDPDVWLSRDDTAAALTEAGLPTSPKTLQTAVTRDPLMPPYRINGRRAEHQWGPTLQWRMSRVQYRGSAAPEQSVAA